MNEDMKADLPPLPEPAFSLYWRDGAYRVSIPNLESAEPFTASQMRDYARAAILSERERCAHPNALTDADGDPITPERLAAWPSPGSAGWLTIESAPKSPAVGRHVQGVYLLGFCPEPDTCNLESAVCVIWWEPLMKKGAGMWYGEGGYEVHPTHWMPLPPPPGSAPAVPMGYKLVPVSPTAAMVDAGLAEHDGSAAPEDEMAGAYRAMVAAAVPGSNSQQADLTQASGQTVPGDAP